MKRQDKKAGQLLNHPTARRSFIATATMGLTGISLSLSSKAKAQEKSVTVDRQYPSESDWVTPLHLYYSTDHIWIRVNGNIGTVGVTDRYISRGVYVENIKLSKVGRSFKASHSFGTVNLKDGSLKPLKTTFTKLNMPVAGRIIEINKRLQDHPEEISDDPYGRGWVIRIRLKNIELRSLMNAPAYDAFTKCLPLTKSYPDSGYVVTAQCVDCKYTDCAVVCPVEAFHELPDRLYINQYTCISCDACVPECPAQAIFSDVTLPTYLQGWVQLNQEAQNYPMISSKKIPLHGPRCSPKPFTGSVYRGAMNNYRSTSKTDIEAMVRQIIKGLNVQENKISPDAVILTDLGLDSFDVFNLFIELEFVFHMSIPDSDCAKLKRISDVIDYLWSRMK